MYIGQRRIDDPSDCYVVAEVGHNHQGSVEIAKRMFKAAAEAGADAVKLQKRDNRTLYTGEFFAKPYENDNSFGATYGAHREFLEFGRAEYLELQDFAHELGVTFFATAFDLPSVDFLEGIGVPAYKVASADVCNIPLLRGLAQTGKPIILSTGGASIEEVCRAYEVLSAGAPSLAVLQCTAGYPAAWDELDLRVIDTYRRLFPGAVVGLSSHDNGIAMAVAAYVLGGRIVEKHFTLDRTMRGSDHAFSLEPQGLRKMVRDLRRTRLALGDGKKRAYESEFAPITKMAKKLVAVRDLPAGHVVRAEDVAARSPGDGLSPSWMDQVVGKRLAGPLAADADFSLELLCDTSEPARPLALD